MRIFDKKIRMETIKKCSKCLIEKPISEFFRDKQKRDGYNPHCKTCDKEISKNWRKSNPEQRKYNVLKCATGVTKEQYIDLLQAQDGKCAICGTGIEENNRRLSVDHCHDDNIVRGLLCTKCNFGLGYFNDNENLLLKAINYLHNNYKHKNIMYNDRTKKT